MVEVSLRMDALDTLQQISIASVPHLKEDDARKVINDYRRAAEDPLELIEKISDKDDDGDMMLLEGMLK